MLNEEVLKIAFSTLKKANEYVKDKLKKYKSNVVSYIPIEIDRDINAFINDRVYYIVLSGNGITLKDNSQFSRNVLETDYDDYMCDVCAFIVDNWNEIKTIINETLAQYEKEQNSLKEKINSYKTFNF
jgi:hypothetical protein